MSKPAVKFDRHAIAAVDAVAASSLTVRERKRDLAIGLREAMRALHLLGVPVFEGRVIARFTAMEDFKQLPPPADLAPQRDCVEQPGLIGQLTAERASQPADYLLEGRRSLRWVQQGFFDRRLRRIPVRIRWVIHPSQPVHAQPR